MKTDLRVQLFHQAAVELGEGILWHPVTQTLWWVDITGQKIFEVDGNGNRLRCLAVPQLVSALVPEADGNLLVALRDGISRLDARTNQLTFLIRPPEHDPQQFRFNDGKCDPRGRLIAGTMGLTAPRPPARLYRFDADRSTHVLVEGVGISNGLAWSADGTILYYIDTPTGLVKIYNYNLATGEIKQSGAFPARSNGGSPDGCTIDTQGRLWIAFWDGACVSCWDPHTGKELDQIALPVAQVTNCTFGGPHLDRLYITTAASGLTKDEHVAQPHAGSIFVANVNARGRPAALARMP